MRLLCTLLCAVMLSSGMSFGQETSNKWKDTPLQVVISPYVWLPWINGELSLDRQLKNVQPDIAVNPIDLLKNVRAAAMVHTQLSKGHFVADVDYIYLLLKSEGGLFESASGDDLILTETRLKGNIIQFTTGGRIIRDIVHFDPYVGVRYANFRTELDLVASAGAREVTGKLDFWDVLIGARLTLFPHPKVPLTLEGDIGGFRAGSDFSWSSEVSAGYSVSRLVDIFASIKTWSFDYAKEGSDNSLELNMFGFAMGANFYIPKRPEKEPESLGMLY